MKIYQRINRNLLLARLFFFAIILLSVFLIMHSLQEYVYAISIFILIGTLIPISSFILYTDRLNIRQYFFYGLILRNVTFHIKDHIVITPFEIELNEPATSSDMESWSMNPILLKRYSIKQQTEFGGLKQVKLKLSDTEIELIKKHFIINNALPI